VGVDTNGFVGDLSQRTEAGDFDEIERSFFASAPPEIAVPPPAPASFEDLEPVRPARVRPRRARPARRPVGALAARLGPGTRRAWLWAEERARDAVVHLVPATRVARARLARGLGAIAARVGKDLPESPDGKTIAAAFAALVVVFGLSARVLGSRSNPRLPTTAELAQEAPLVVVAPVAPEAGAPEPSVTFLAPTVTLQRKHAHAGKRHAPVLMKPAFMR